MFEIKENFDPKAVDGCLVIGVFEDDLETNEIFNEIDQQFTNELTKLISTNNIKLTAKSITSLFTFGKISAKQLIIVGLGPKSELTTNCLRETFGKLFKTVKQQAINNVTLHLDTFTKDGLEIAQVAELTGESLLLSTYELVDYKQQSDKVEQQIEKVIIYSKLAELEIISAALNVGYAYGKATNSARSLVNLPSNFLNAAELANYAEQLADKYNFEIEVLDRDELQSLGMGALLAVNEGSVEPPKMIVLKHHGLQDWTNVIGLVGKGITYDTGGYSLKPRTGMVGMKSDMGGAAAVLGAFEIIGELQLEQNVIGVIPATDNMVSGQALKPDDVITSLSGKTIEVLNTDAEGRLVLADAVTYVKQQGANYIVDIATLTGGVIVALGNETTGVITNSEQLYEQVESASKITGEQIWQLPLFEKDRQRVRDSKFADLNNSPGREGHAIMGGAFIGEFAEDTPWVHLDIAGTATTKASTDLCTSGATGVMTRTLAKLVTNFKPF